MGQSTETPVWYNTKRKKQGKKKGGGFGQTPIINLLGQNLHKYKSSFLGQQVKNVCI